MLGQHGVHEATIMQRVSFYQCLPWGVDWVEIRGDTQITQGEQSVALYTSAINQ